MIGLTLAIYVVTGIIVVKILAEIINGPGGR